MSYFEFPHTRNYDGDLGYIIKKLEELNERYNNFFEYNTIRFHDPITWNISDDYPANNIVYDPVSEAFYFSKQAVPSGIDISNSDYWLFISPFKTDNALNINSLNPIANRPVTEKFGLLDTSVTELNARLTAEISNRAATEAQLSSRITSAENAVAQESTTRSAADVTINARIDEIISGGTVDPSAELLDIRVGYQGETYNNAGNAVRGQIQDIYNNITEKTDNLICGVLEHSGIESNATIYTSGSYTSSMVIVPVIQGESYTFKVDDTRIVGGYFENFPKAGDVAYLSTRVVSTLMTLTATITGFFAFRVAGDVVTNKIQVNKGTVLLDYNKPVIATDNKARASISTLTDRFNTALSNHNDFVLTNAFDVGSYSGYINNNGTISGNPQYEYSELMPTKPGDVWLFTGKMTAAAFSPVWGYSNSSLANATALMEAGSFDGHIIITVPAGIYYIRAFGLSHTVTNTTNKLLHGSNILFWGSIYPGSTNSIRTVFSSITDASCINRYKVYVLPGTYSFDNEFTETELSTPGFRGVVVPDWVTLESIYGGTIFECSISSTSISVLNLGIGSSLKNLTVRGSNCRYAVHDDFGYNNDEGEKTIENCVISSTQCAYGYAYGAGCRSGEHFTFKNVKFIGNTYEDGGFLMHSNTSFTSPCVIEMFNCQFLSLNGHPERACNIRALGSTSTVNKLYINNSRINGMYLQVSEENIIDWTIEGAGNNSNYTLVTQSNDFKPDFFDED